MHEHGCAIYVSTFSVASASDKTGAYQNIYVADVNAASYLYRSAFWTVTLWRTGYANVNCIINYFRVFEWKLKLLRF